MRKTLISRTVILALMTVFASTVQAQHQIHFPKWVKAQIIDRIELTGYRQLGFHSHTVSGDRTAFDSLANSGQGLKRFTDQGIVGVTGRKVFGALDFDFTFLDSRFSDPQGQKLTIDYKYKGLRTQLGDIQGTIGGGLTSIRKTVRGVQMQYGSGRTGAKVLYSSARGSARSVSINGNNTAGPYYLQNSQIVNGSEEVRLDNTILQIQRDYTINYELGAITLINRIVPPTSTLIVSFEALGYNADQASIRGAELSYDFGRFGRVGAAAITQTSASGVRLSQVVEKFQGFGAPSTPYFLQFEPYAARPITIKVDGITQTIGVDFAFDTGNPSIFYFSRFMPATSNIDVFYTPSPRETGAGDRESLGLSYVVDLGKNKNGELILSQSTGRLKSVTSPLSGIARSGRVRYSTGGWNFNGSLRDIPRGYVTVESRGLSRNEKAVDWSLQKSPLKGLDMEVAQTNSSISSRKTNPDGSFGFATSRFTSSRATARYRPSSGGPWNLEYRQSRARNGAQISSLDTVTLGTNQNWDKFRLGLDLSRQSGSGRSASGETGKLTLDTLELRAGYNPTPSLSLRGTASVSSIRSGSDKGTGTDVSFNATYRPGDAWQIAADYALSESGRLARLGYFDSGFGLGYEGSGFNAGLPSGNPLGASNSRVVRLASSYYVDGGIALTAAAQNTSSTGSVSSNAETTSYSFSLSSPIGRSHQVAASIDTSSTRFADSNNRLDSTTFNIFAEGSPAPKWSWRAGASFLLSGGNSEFNQNSSSFETSISYALGKRQSLSFFLNSGNTSGYLPQADLDASLTYSYRIWGNLALATSYRFRNVRNLDPDLKSGAYRSSGFDISLNFQFGR